MDEQDGGSTSRARAGASRGLVAVLVAAGLVIVGLVLYLLLSGGDRGPGPTADAPSSTRQAEETPTGLLADVEVAASSPARREAADPTAIGAVDAPVAMVVYSDYLCSHCQRLAVETLPKLEPQVEDGTLRVEFRDLEWLGPESGVLARAAYAAGLQGEFLDYHDGLMADAAGFSAADVTPEALTRRAVDLGLDGERFAADLGSGATARGVERNREEALALGIQGTPLVYVGRYVIPGAYPVEYLRAAIDASIEG